MLCYSWICDTQRPISYTEGGQTHSFGLLGFEALWTESVKCLEGGELNNFIFIQASGRLNLKLAAWPEDVSCAYAVFIRLTEAQSLQSFQ